MLQSVDFESIFFYLSILQFFFYVYINWQRDESVTQREITLYLVKIIEKYLSKLWIVKQPKLLFTNLTEIKCKKINQLAECKIRLSM